MPVCVVEGEGGVAWWCHKPIGLMGLTFFQAKGQQTMAYGSNSAAACTCHEPRMAFYIFKWLKKN